MCAYNVPSYNKFWPEDGLMKPKHLAKTMYYLLYIDVVLWLNKILHEYWRTQWNGSYQNSSLLTADTILWCTKNPVPNWWFPFPFPLKKDIIACCCIAPFVPPYLLYTHPHIYWNSPVSRPTFVHECSVWKFMTSYLRTTWVTEWGRKEKKRKKKRKEKKKKPVAACRSSWKKYAWSRKSCGK